MADYSNYKSVLLTVSGRGRVPIFWSTKWGNSSPYYRTLNWCPTRHLYTFVFGTQDNQPQCSEA